MKMMCPPGYHHNNDFFGNFYAWVNDSCNWFHVPKSGIGFMYPTLQLDLLQLSLTIMIFLKLSGL